MKSETSINPGSNVRIKPGPKWWHGMDARVVSVKGGVAEFSIDGWKLDSPFADQGKTLSMVGEAPISELELL